MYRYGRFNVNEHKCLICSQPAEIKQIVSTLLYSKQTRADLRQICKKHSKAIEGIQSWTEIIEFWRASGNHQVAERIVYLQEISVMIQKIKEHNPT